MAEIRTASAPGSPGGPVNKMLALIDGEKGKIQGMLPSFMAKNADRFMAFALQAAQNPSLAKCIEQNPLSVISAIARSAQLGLLIDGRKMAMVPRKMNGVMTACPEVMYAGLLDLVRRLGDITTAKAEVVYRHEVEAGAFEYAEGTDAYVKHRPIRTPDIALKDEDIWFAYAWCLWRDGHKEAKVITRQDIEKARSTSQAKSEYAPWQQWFPEMAMKTAIKRLCKTLPMPDDVQQALADEDRVIAEAREAESEQVSSRPLTNLDDLVRANTPAPAAEPEPQAVSAEIVSAVPRMVQGIPVAAGLFWNDVKDVKFSTGPKLLVGKTTQEVKALYEGGDKAVQKQVAVLMEAASEMYSNGEEPSRPYQMVSLMLEQIQLGERF